VNLIGEHTDYNDGIVLPMALRIGIRAAVARRADHRWSFASSQKRGRVELAPDQLVPGEVDGWAAYVAGVVWALREAGHEVGGYNVLYDSDLPAGAGLSSSAALECVTALAIADLEGLGIDGPTLAMLAHRAENEFVGVPTGIMDQFASLLCSTDHALLLDTRSLEGEHVPLPLERQGLVLLVIDTRVSRRLVDGEYAARRQTCEEAARALGVAALRDVPLAALGGALTMLADEEPRRRVRHVVTEIGRVLDAASQLRAGHVELLGPLLNASHASLRDDYEVSSGELDVAVDAALGAGAIGARLTGAGFGGCAMALVHAPLADSVTEAVEEAFSARAFRAPRCMRATPGPGARRLA
jgi:galactokinase